jgi:hypothetical protein
MNVVLMLAHSIEEYQQVRLMHELGHQVFSIGAYIDPSKPGDDKRPALPEVPFHADLAEAVWATPSENGDSLWAAKDNLPQVVIDWADVIICHHVEWRWLLGNWPRIRDKRVVWRTVGQSTHENEVRMAPLRAEGLQIVRYSPREKHIPYYAGEDVLIRFWQDTSEMTGWTGDDCRVANVTQDMRGRGDWTGWPLWQQVTQHLPTYPAGPKSDEWGGAGALSYEDLKAYLRRMRTYFYTGTFPASYTLGLLEAMATGIPVIAAGPNRWKVFRQLPYAHLLYEAHEIAGVWADDWHPLSKMVGRLLDDRSLAEAISREQQQRIRDEFSLDVVKAAWRDFLG